MTKMEMLNRLIIFGMITEEDRSRLLHCTLDYITKLYLKKVVEKLEKQLTQRSKRVILKTTKRKGEKDNG